LRALSNPLHEWLNGTVYIKVDSLIYAKATRTFEVKMEVKTLVKKMVEPKESYKCEKCGTVYQTSEEAVKCESNPISPFKYEIGDAVRFVSVAEHYIHSVSIPTGVIEERWINGLPRKDEPAHGNVYKLRIIAGKGKGLTTRLFEDDVIGKADKYAE
jgi:hypothetical protein